MTRKDFKIVTNAFELTIHWNGKVVGLHLSILIGVLAFMLLAKNPNVIMLSKVALVFDLVCIVIGTLMGAYTETVDSENSDTKETKSKIQSKEAPDIKVEHSKASKEEKKPEKPKRKREEVINNKVPIPEQPKNTTREKPKMVVSADDLTDEDWEELFRM